MGIITRIIATMHTDITGTTGITDTTDITDITGTTTARTTVPTVDTITIPAASKSTAGISRSAWAGKTNRPRTTNSAAVRNKLPEGMVV